MYRQSSAALVMPALRISFLFAILLSLWACQQTPTVEFKGQRFSVEIADSPEEQARGMMFREKLEPNAGMLFIFNDMQPRAFWMHNCKISLDILYFDADKKLVSSALNVPPCNLPPQQCPNYPSNGPAKYVLELNGGRATELGAQIGDVMVFSP